MPKSAPAILQKVRRRLETFLGLGPRASDNLTGFLNGEDVRRLVAKPVLPDVDKLSFHNPSKEIQERYVGGSFHVTFTEAADFLNYLIERQYPAGVSSNSDCLKVLDYGCGWGRMLRILRSKKELQSINFYGCDPLRDAVEICRRSIPDVYVTRCSLYPPSDYRDGLFDLIYAYSVFSHLSEDCHLAWAAEFARILKPRGTVCLTTQARSLIQVCEEYRSGKRAVVSGWHKSLYISFSEPDAADRYDAGEFLYSATGGGAELVKQVYGEAIVPKQFFEKRWSEFGFELVDWWEHPAAGSQNRVFLRKCG